MASSPPGAAQIVQATGNDHDKIGTPLGRVTELVFGDATDLHPRHRMLHAHSGAGQVAIVPFLARRQLPLLRLFFGCRCTRTAGA